jgi:hypothetical protein
MGGVGRTARMLDGTRLERPLHTRVELARPLDNSCA